MSARNLLSKLLISAFMVVFIFVIQVYTWITLPIYFLVQKPWINRAKNDAKRVRIFDPSKNNSTFTVPNHDSNRAKSPNEPLMSPIYERVDTQIYDFNYFKYDNLVDMFDHMGENFNPNSPCIGYRQILSEEQLLDDNKNVRRVDGQRLRQFKLSDYIWQTYTEFFDNCKFIAQALMAKGIKKGDKLMIISETRYEWMTIFNASLRAGIQMVTVFPNLGFEGIINAIEESQIETVVTSTENVDLLRRILDKCNHSIKLIIYFDRLNQKIDSFPNNIEVMSFSEILQMGKTLRIENKEKPFPVINSKDILIIIYTSGTTGKPKAAVISNEQFYGMIQALYVLVRHLVKDGPKNIYIAYLPMAHILELTLEIFFFLAGCRVGYSSPLTITDSAPGLAPGQKSDIKLLKPTIMTTVPLVLDRIIKETNEKLRSRTPVSLPIFNYLIDYKSRWVRRGYRCNIVTKLLCPKVQEQFGGQLTYMICGGAPLNANVQAIIKSALDVNLIQGYGATETTGAVICMDFDVLDYGNVGAPLGEVKFRLRDWNEGGYSVLDKPNPRGEILVGGNIISLGYFAQSEMTKNAFHVDEYGIRWFHTGDIGEMYPNGTIKIIDRCKDLIKLQNGEYISLGKIEAVLKSSVFVENACVYGGTFSNDLVALISPHRKALNELVTRLGKSHLTIEEICKDERIQNEIYEDISQVSKRLLLSKKETPKRIKLVPEVWSPDNDILTGALKLKRRVIETMYKQELFDLYNCKKFNIITTNGIDQNNNAV